MIRDFFEILFQCVAAVDSGAFLGILTLALVLGLLCWVACSYYTRLWNKRFRVKLQHHVLCAIAAFLTALFVISYHAVDKLEFIVNDIIDVWNTELLDNKDWTDQTYETAFFAVKKVKPAAFANVPEPGNPNSYIPFNDVKMIQTCVETYVEKACDNFSTIHPFLNLMLSAKPGVSQEEIIADIHEYFQTVQVDVYPLSRAVEIAARNIRENLLEQSPKTVWKTSLILVILFMVVQLIPFGFIGYCAYKDLKISNDIQFYQY